MSSTPDLLQLWMFKTLEECRVYDNGLIGRMIWNYGLIVVSQEKGPRAQSYIEMLEIAIKSNI